MRFNFQHIVSAPAKYFRLLLCLLLLMGSGLSVQASVTGFACDAEFEYKAYEGPLPQIGGITFSNLSTGDYTNVTWDFGDGTFSSDLVDTIDHFYAESGVYEVSLDIWDNAGCMSSYPLTVVVNLNNGNCQTGDCVYPGDVNLDGKVDMYDLIPFGLGFGATGPVRPDATLDFEPQPAADWQQVTPDGINYKHLDCDGNGVIDFADTDAININYGALDDSPTPFEDNDPLVYFDFDKDTIYLNEDTPDLIPITARLMIGDSSNELEECHGIALKIDYDSIPVDDRSAVNLQYNETSFFGDINQVIPIGIDLRGEEQFDMGFTRTDRQLATGSGHIASINFIIIHDIIGGRAAMNNDLTEYELPITAIKALDSLGQKIDVSIKTVADKIVFINEKTAVNDPILQAKIRVSPNPVAHRLHVQIDDLDPETIELTDISGRPISSLSMNSRLINIDVNDLPAGLYLLKIYTEQGLVIKRFVKK